VKDHLLYFSLAARNALPLHGDAGGITNLDPDAAPAGLIGAVDLLRYDALGTNAARMAEHSRPIFGGVFVKQDASHSIAPQPRRRA
jgi:hypothetical protein